ncbi:hypothetical protein N7456_006977 [Penicillium angulare]|uniref:Uncharacterized protein n=1 Tax=Penicillium angulare TaxID=116970 RepID=A0A9W9FIP5_9EURO|nr:hypothetical protein N7456_006977 [Penicillium angulare]
MSSMYMAKKVGSTGEPVLMVTIGIGTFERPVFLVDFIVVSCKILDALKALLGTVFFLAFVGALVCLVMLTEVA